MFKTAEDLNIYFLKKIPLLKMDIFLTVANQKLDEADRRNENRQFGRKVLLTRRK